MQLENTLLFHEWFLKDNNTFSWYLWHNLSFLIRHCIEKSWEVDSANGIALGVQVFWIKIRMNQLLHKTIQRCEALEPRTLRTSTVYSGVNASVLVHRQTELQNSTWINKLKKKNDSKSVVINHTCNTGPFTWDQSPYIAWGFETYDAA